ncbi:unnamed protein product [Rotaria sp. Silwood2]|nr:unnamed protein product [Rotaria sp. Silwood2]CAF4035524.1 unnamed protein product [Rotaria sp. Silwood2]
MILRFLLIIFCQWTLIYCQLNLYNTDRSMNDNSLQFDCLYYRVRYEKLAYQELSNVIDNIIPYCFRPINQSELLTSDFENTHSRTFTFDELRFNNVTTQQLLSWSASIDLVEQYQFYLNEINPSLSSLSNELFYNCTKPWFGLQCQYSFEFSEEMSINHIVETEFSRKTSYSESSKILTKLSCYIHLKCDRGGPLLCLDWREICDGRVDCLDGGLDEAFCFDMEINECNQNEYRCHNGLCIPEEFWNDGIGDADCLDRSDEIADISYPRSCFQDPTFRCEEHSCRTNWHQFPCGDGQCVQKFDTCHNGRHALLIQSMTFQGHLPNKCWIAMICLTMLVNEVNGISCQSWLIKDSVIEFLQTCDFIFQFPTIPVHLGHIRFLYEQPHLKLNRSSFMLPDYVCYDEKLCDCIIPTFFHGNLSCLHRNELQLQLTISGHPWIDMILEINYHFSSCLITHTFFDNKIMYRNISSLYSCQNSSKLISKHRIADENKDCCMDDDEDPQLSCLLNDKYRVKCPSQDICLSSLHSIHDCPESQNQYYNHVPFYIFCDGFEEHSFEDFNDQSYTDESECNYWPCNNIYSQCDGFWRCSNGEDEDNCHHIICPSGTHPCISPINYSLTCLSAERVGDEIDDCLGASDEIYFCRQLYPLKKDYERFRCTNSDLCLSIFELCDSIQSCPLGDDEKFCKSQQFICQENSFSNNSLIEDVLCQLSEYKKSRIIHFSIRTGAIYPHSTSAIIDSTMPWTKEQQHRNFKTIQSRMNNSSWPWYCNRGLTTRIWFRNDLFKYGCMCPPSYYGDLCQYQNERVSLTLGLIRAEKHNVYTIVIMLIDDNDEQQEIDSYDQFDYAPSRSCGIKLNRYLLYSTRPKNISKNYSIRIDAFEKNAMTYCGSWHLSIPFLLLPVNRLATLLAIPYHPVPISFNCSITCKNGECIKYINKDKYFCRCFSGWSGVQCNIPINCKSCSSDSICVGTVKNRPICICSLTKFGPRCLLTSLCTINACENNGQCISTDISFSNTDYACICPDQFFGPKCQYVKAKLDISLENLDIPSYLTAFFFTVSEQSEPTCTIMLQKLTLFQRIITFRISVPYHIVVIKSNDKFYLGVVQQTPKIDISTSINPTRECFPIEEIFNSTFMKMPQFHRIKFYHIPCQTNFHLNCFIDETYLCLCTTDHHANCVEFDHHKNLQCPSKHYCANGAQCLQDHPNCPSSIICVCNECFFGNQCQFYSKGFGLSLDEILGYEIKRNVFLFKQSFAVKLSALITMIMFTVGIINGIFSILTFKNKNSQAVGCGIYLLASSITSLLIVILFTLKFWFLILSYIDFFAQRVILYSNCMVIEPLLKVLLYIDNWLNGCVAVERSFAVFKEVHFNKKKSKKIAKWMIGFMIFINIILLIPQLSNLHLFDDEKEERTWCVVLYSSSLHIYNSFIIFFHFLTPFFINLFSAIFIIIATGRQRGVIKSDYLYMKQFKNKLRQHKHLLISPIILIMLSLPRLIISFTLDCKKSSKHFWLYLIGYFVSFMPSILVFVVFVLPSTVFKKGFKEVIRHGRRRASLFKMDFYSNKRR